MDDSDATLNHDPSYAIDDRIVFGLDETFIPESSDQDSWLEVRSIGRNESGTINEKEVEPFIH